MEFTHGKYLRLLSGLYLSTFLIRTSFGIMLIAFYSFLGLDKPIDQRIIGEGVYGLVVAFSPLAEMITVLFIGVMIDKRGRRGILLFGLLLGSCALFFLPVLQILPVVGLIIGSGIVNAIHGISAAAILVSSLALLADYAPPSSRGREMGAFDAINLMGWIAGFAIGFILSETYTSMEWMSFTVAGILALFGFVYAFFNISEPQQQKFVAKDIGVRNIIDVIKQRSVLLIVLPWFIVYLLIGSLFAFLAGARQGLGISGYLLALGVAGAGIVIISTQILYGKLSDKYGRIPILLTGAIGFAGLMAVVGIAYFGMPSNQVTVAEHLKTNLLHLWPFLGIFGLMALAFGPAALASLADVAQEKRKGITMGLYTITIAIGMALGPILTGFIYEHFGGEGVLILLLLCAVILLLIVVFRWIDSRLSVKKTA